MSKNAGVICLWAGVLAMVCPLASADILLEKVDELSRQLEHQQEMIDVQKAEISALKANVQDVSEMADLANRIKWNGFISAGVAKVDASEEVQWGNSGPDNELDWNSDTIIAIQARFIITDSLQVVSQMMSRGGFESEFDADWFYLQYQVNENVDVMLGRVRPQFFMLSDYVEVGFAYPWIRPPAEVYDPIPTDWAQGVSLNMNWEGAGNTYHNAALQLLQSEDQGTVSRFDVSVIGVMYEFNYGPFTLALRGGSMRADTYLENETFRSVNRVLESFDEDIAIIPNEDTEITYRNVGIRYETEKWLILSEWATFDIQGLFVDTESYYLTLGRRFGKWMPHLTFAHHESTDDDIREDARIIDALGAATGGTIQEVAQGLWNQQNDSYTLGINYSFNSNTVIKLEAKRITNRDGTIAQFEKSKTTDEIDTVVIPEQDNIMIYGFVVDMVF
ncbi:hypothetical protein A9Q99_11745 [Gammaproteobacteria bacterium 45_16_T64]|nr:hypothetical protein A9Q99_11745 [Gammaproteobacteria bacterium 45_16_T64]